MNNRLHSILGDLQPLHCEHFSHVIHALGSNDTLFIVKGQSMLFKLSHYFVKVFTMLLVVTTNYSPIIMQVVSARAILQYLSY